MIIGDGIVLGAGGETASIIVTAPTGSTVTCTTPGGIVLTATEVSGTWTFTKLKVYGTYTVTATNGTKTATQDVLVDSATQYDIELEYKLWLYKDGDECENITGGWVGTDGGYYASGNYTSGVKTANSLLLDGSTDGGYDKYLGTNYAIDFTNYSVLKCERIAVTANESHPTIRVLGDNGRFCGSSNIIVIAGGTISNQVEILEADVSSVTGAHYVVVACTSSSGKGYVYKVWLE